MGASHQDLMYFFCFRGKQIQLPVSISVFCLFDRALSFSHFALSILMFFTLHSAVCFLGSFPLFKMSAQELQTCSLLLDPKAPGLLSILHMEATLNRILGNPAVARCYACRNVRPKGTCSLHSASLEEASPWIWAGESRDAASSVLQVQVLPSHSSG